MDSRHRRHFHLKSRIHPPHRGEDIARPWMEILGVGRGIWKILRSSAEIGSGEREGLGENRSGGEIEKDLKSRRG